MKKMGILILKISVAIGLLAFLFHSGALDLSKLSEVKTGWIWLIPASMPFPVILTCGVIRLRWLLAAQEIYIGYYNVIRYTCIGQFFSVCLPGVTSGDIIKAGYLARDVGKPAASILAVILDRVVGLISLMLFTLLMILFNLHSILSVEPLKKIAFFVFVIVGGCTIAAMFVFKKSNGEDIASAPGGSQQKIGILASLRQAVTIYRYKRACIFKCMAISMVSHVSTILGIYCLGRALKESLIGLRELSYLAPLGLVINAIPASIGGWGIGEWGLGFLYKLMKSDNGASVMLIFHVLFTLGSLMCGIFYLLEKKSSRLSS